jgi:hypothetical protein
VQNIANNACEASCNRLEGQRHGEEKKGEEMAREETREHQCESE